MGRYLSERSVGERDRVITAQAWARGGMHPGEYTDDTPACLVEHVARGCKGLHYAEFGGAIGFRHFDRAVRRFGLPRVVRALKLRAAKLNNSAPDMIAAITEAGQTREGVGL